MNKISDFTRAVVTALEGNNTRINYEELDAGAEIKKSLQKSITSACAQAMMVDDKTVAVKMSNIVENLDGAHDAVLPNSLAFRIVVSMLADQVWFTSFSFLTSPVLSQCRLFGGTLND